MPTTLARLSPLLFLAASLATAGCSRVIRGADTGGSVVIFSNNSLDATTVFAARPGGDPRRLTTVMPGRTDTLRLPSDVASAGSITILAGSAGRTYSASTGSVSIGPGTWLAVTLNSAGNSLSVFPARRPPAIEATVSR